MQRKRLTVLLSLVVAFAMCVGMLPMLFSANVAYAAYVTDPATYYNGITATSGQELLGQLHDLIVTTHKTYTSYDDCRDYAEITDPGSKSGAVMEFYTQEDIVDYVGQKDANGSWNREHLWAQADTIQSGNTKLWGTEGGGSDLHHIRPAEKKLNADRGNKLFGEVSNKNSEYYAINLPGKGNVLGGWAVGNTFEPLNKVKGDIARILMYLYTHYNNASIVNGTVNSAKTSGILPITKIVSASTEQEAWDLLLKWNKLDPVNDIEINRNNEVAKIQGNRNPFIDNANYANLIWGDGEVEDVTLTNLTLDQTSLSMAVGATQKLNVSATPVNAVVNIEWTSANPSVATVSNGTVTAVAPGMTTITAKDTTTNISVTATVSVKSVRAIAVSGTPTKTAYKAGEAFDPTGLTVTATYSDDTTGVLDSSSCQWLDGTDLSATLKAGTTSVVCKFGELLKPVSAAITVSEVTGSEITVTAVSFKFASNAYGVHNWTQDGIGGTAYVYGGNTATLQFSAEKGRSCYLSSNVATPGGILSITMYSSGTDRKWELRTNNSPYSAPTSGKYSSDGTSHGEQTVTADGTTWELDGKDTYFTLNYKETSGAGYITKIVIVYSTAPAIPDEVELEKETATLYVGDTEKLAVTANGEVTWTSNNTAVATVSNDGTVTAKAKGTATITATVGTATAECVVTVKEHDSVSLNKTSAELVVGKTLTLVADKKGESELVWTSSAPTVLTVTNGIISAVAEGTATVTATVGKATATCTVTVSNEISLDKDTAVLKPAGNITLVATASTPSIVHWYSSNSSVATVANGVVTAVGNGTATIIASCGSASAHCVVLVTNEDVSLEETVLTTTYTQKDISQFDGNGLTFKTAQEIFGFTNNRGVQFNKQSNLTLTSATSVSKVTKVVVGVSTNIGSGVDVAVSVGGTAMTSQNAHVANGTSVTEVEFTSATSLNGVVVITFTDSSAKSVFVSSVVITCGDAVEVPQPTDSLELDVTELSLTEVNQTKKITATASGDVFFVSSDISVVTVADDGTVTALKEGSATITATCGTVSKTCAVTVLFADSVSLDNETATLIVGEEITLVATKTGASSVVWSSSDDAVATVVDGKVTALKEGKVTITATVGTAKAECVVTISNTISLSKTTENVQAGQTVTLLATATTPRLVAWSSSDQTIATVLDGVVTGVKAGTVTITATCGTATATCEVTVTAAPAVDPEDSVSLNETKLEITINESVKLVATASGDVTWTSSDTDIAFVAGNGTVIALAEGTATITATCGTAKATCEVTVKAAPVVEPDSVSLDKDTLSLQVGETSKLVATASGDVTWTSSDSTVVVVLEDGTVSAIKVGTATITATCGTAKATCTVTVTAKTAEHGEATVEEFQAAVAAISAATTRQNKFAAIKAALETYGKLSDSDKTAAASTYAQLQTSIQEYNTSAQKVNDEAISAVKVAATGISLLAVSLAAALFVLKKKW